MALTDDGALLKRVALELLRLIDEADKPPVVVPPVEPPPIGPPLPPQPPVEPISFQPEDLGKLKETVAGQGVKVPLAVLTPGMTAIDWTVVRGREPWDWRVYPPIRVQTTGIARIEPTFYEDEDFVKVLWADDYSVSKDSARVSLEQAAPPPPPPGGTGAINIMVRGQSNALLFCDWGGAGTLYNTLRSATGRPVNLIYSWGEGTRDYTIYSGSGFISWNTDGKQAGIERKLRDLPGDQKGAPFITLWLHNESDMKDHKNEWTRHSWAQRVREDTAMMRAAVGRSAADAPVCFVPIRYNYGDITEIRAGMDILVADRAFNAWLSMAAWGAKMDGDGRPDSSHMGPEDSKMIGRALGQEIAARYPRA